MRVLVVGYFSTFGDLEVLRQVERHLRDASIAYDVGAYSKRINKHLTGSVDVTRSDPADYTHLCVVCGPFSRKLLRRKGLDLERFAHCTRIGVNLTVLEFDESQFPLDTLLGRDGVELKTPDLSFLEDLQNVPVVGLCLVETQGEYGDRQRHDQAGELLCRFLDRANVGVIELDTRWPPRNDCPGLSSPEQFESVCSRLDVMFTTRLHGMVLALKNGTPVVAIDAISGGGKVSKQGRAIGWPEVFSIDDSTEAMLDEALARCLDAGARKRALACADAARSMLAGFSDDLRRAVGFSDY